MTIELTYKHAVVFALLAVIQTTGSQLRRVDLRFLWHYREAFERICS